MLDVGPAGDDGEAELAGLVDRLAAAGRDPATSAARTQIRRTIAEGASPPGLRRLAEGLVASAGELLPPPRRPMEGPQTLVDVVRSHALVVAEDFDTAAVAAAVAALVADGRRVVVTGPAQSGTDAVRVALPAALAGRVLDRLPALSPAELRELRRLLVLATPGRRARPDQVLPADTELPPVDEVTDLCRRAGPVGPPPSGPGCTALVPGLLAGVPAERRAAVTSVARFVTEKLAALPPREQQPWVWQLLSDLVHARHRTVFDRMLEDTAQAVTALDRAGQGPPVVLTGPPLPGAAAVLCRYRDFLDAGGRSRAYFRGSAQREVQPVLAQVRVDDRVPRTSKEIQRVIEHLELGDRLSRVDAGCLELGIAPPRDEAELGLLAESLVAVAAAARSVGALRHDVLFLTEDSPLSVPDVDAAQEVARAVLDHAENGPAGDAAGRLDEMVERLDAAGGSTGTAAPELRRAVAALRARDATAYAAALDAVAGARREVRDETACRTLLERLSATSPALAQAWSTAWSTPGRAALGLACFVPVEALLTSVPAPDSADVVIVLGAAGLGVERLLLTAVAPRMVAVLAPGDEPAEDPTLVSVLRRASALVVRGRVPVGARVVPITSGPSSRDAAARAGA